MFKVNNKNTRRTSIDDFEQINFSWVIRKYCIWHASQAQIQGGVVIPPKTEHLNFWWQPFFFCIYFTFIIILYFLISLFLFPFLIVIEKCLIGYLRLKSLVSLFAFIRFVNILLFHRVYFTSFFGRYIEQNICFIHLEETTGRFSTR